jgi:WD40 repeat protein
MGPVYAVDFSLFHRNVFVSSSLDGTIKLYDLLQAKSLSTYEVFNNYVFKVMWSYVRPCVFAAALSDGNVNIYDLSSKRKDPIAVL